MYACEPISGRQEGVAFQCHILAAVDGSIRNIQLLVDDAESLISDTFHQDCRQIGEGRSGKLCLTLAAPGVILPSSFSSLGLVVCNCWFRFPDGVCNSQQQGQA